MRAARLGRLRAGVLGMTAVLIALPSGCGSAHWVRNGFLDPTQVGRFSRTTCRSEIRQTVSLLEEPVGIQNAEEPTASDLMPSSKAEAIGPGDVIVITIHELLQPGIPTTQQLRVGKSGFETIPTVGPVRVVGLTARELELELKERLRESEILPDADVLVSVIESQKARYSVVGAAIRPGMYPLPGPDFRILSAIAMVGGIPPHIRSIYVLTQRGSNGENGEEIPLFNDDGAPQAHVFGGDKAWKHDGLEGEGVSYTLSDVGGGTSWTVDDDPPPVGGGGEERGADGAADADVLQSDPAAGEPQIKWDEELGEWVIEEEPASRPTGDTGVSPVAATPTSGTSLPAGEGAETSALAAPATKRVEEVTEETSESVWGEEEIVGPPTRILEIPVKELLDGDPRYNVVLRPYDVVNIPLGPSGEFYLMGHVARPGAYSLTGRRMTLKEAIASAGGFGPLAWPARADLTRRLNDNEEQIIQLDLDAIFAGEAPDLYLKPNDIINVGTTAPAYFLAVLRNAFRFTYGMGFVYDRNFADSDTFTAREQVKARRNNEAFVRGLPF